MQRDYTATLDWVPEALEAKDKRQFISRWQSKFARPSDLLEKFTFLPDTSVVEHLPRFGFALQFRFKLRKPYLSKDDRDFYLLENPLRREKVFQTPMVASTAWKGALRATLCQLDKQDNYPAIIRLFGNPRESEEGKSGRLYFFPTFFDKIDEVDLEVINPHDRKTGVGSRGPILMESVPADATGYFTLLYVPFDRLGQDEAETRRQVAEDLTLLAQGLRAMFTLYGFGAKTSSGFGLAEDSLVGQGSLTLHMEDTEQPQKDETQPEDPLQALQADIDAFVERFGVESFPRWTNEELSASGWGKKRQSEYKKLRNRHPDWDAQTGQWRETAPEEASEEEAVPSRLTERTFASFSELVALIERLATSLTAGGDA